MYVEELIQDIEKSDLKKNVEKYSPGDFIRGAGEEFSELLVLKEGEIAIESVGRTGRVLEVERIKAVDLILPCVTFSEDPILDVDLISKTKTIILSIDKTDFLGYIWRNRDGAQKFFSYLGNQFSRIVRRLSEIAMNDLKEKVASYIIELHREQNSEMIEFPVTREELARMLGATRPSISRVLSSLADQGFIEIKRNNLRIKDLDGLRLIAGY